MTFNDTKYVTYASVIFSLLSYYNYSDSDTEWDINSLLNISEYDFEYFEIYTKVYFELRLQIPSKDS